MEQRAHQVRRQRPEAARPEQEACQDLARDVGLPEARRASDTTSRVATRIAIS
jgi:hypothetical protein